MPHNLEITGNIVEVPLDLIKVKDVGYRKKFHNIESLADSISTIGQMIPIMISSDFTIIAGRRRLKACQFIKENWDTLSEELKASSKYQPKGGTFYINAEIKTYDDIQAKLSEGAENLEREQLTWQEEIETRNDMHTMYQATNKHWNLRKTAEKLSASLGSVSMDIKLAEAIKVDPEMFEKAKTKDAAMKILKKYEQDEILTEIKLRKSKTDYGRNAKNYVFNGNCLNLIDDLPAGIVNAIISDPVYGIDINAVKKTNAPDGHDIYEDDPTEYFKLMESLISKFNRVLNPNGMVLLFCRIQNFYWLYEKLTAQGFKCDPIPGIWVRGGGQTNQPNTLMARSYEAFIYGFRGDGMLVKPGLSNVLSYGGVAPVNKLHAVQKPLALMEELINRFCIVGHTILDPMCGSFTTGVAAIKRGCNPIGFELDPENYNTAVARVADTLNAKDAGKLDLVTD